MEKNDVIYQLGLHGTCTVYGGPFTWHVTRVHGGWIYTTGNNDGTTLVNTFVPYTEEATNGT